MGVPVLGGNAGGTSSFLDGGSSNKFLVTTTLLLEPDVEELKGSSVLAFNKENSNIHTFSAILLLLFFSPPILRYLFKSESLDKCKNTFVCF